MEYDNPRPLERKVEFKKCKHGSSSEFCVKCRYLNTGRKKSTDGIEDYDTVEFMDLSFNKRMKSVKKHNIE
jgi:hypothetical protein